MKFEMQRKHQICEESQEEEQLGVDDKVNMTQ